MVMWGRMIMVMITQRVRHGDDNDDDTDQQGGVGEKNGDEGENTPRNMVEGVTSNNRELRI